MKYCDITFRRIADAVIHQWKWLVGMTVVGIAAGLLCGVFFSHRAASQTSGTAEPLESVDFSEVDPSLSYYDACCTVLEKQKQTLLSYLDAVLDSQRVSEANTEELKDFEKDVLRYGEETLTPISKELGAVNRFYLPDGMRQEAIDEYSRLRDEAVQDIAHAEYARQLLDSIGGLSTTDESVNSIYASILNQAFQYGQLKTDLQTYEKRLDLLENNYDVLRQESEEMEQKLEDACDELRDLTEALNQLLTDISGEEALDISSGMKNGELQVSVTYTNFPASEKDAFAAFVVFFSLAGICVGAFAALCKECRQKGNPSPRQEA